MSAPLSYPVNAGQFTEIKSVVGVETGEELLEMVTCSVLYFWCV